MASSSPRRADLLRDAGYLFEVISPQVEEQSGSAIPPSELVSFNAKLKCSAVAQLHPEALVIGADTVVALQSRIYGKPTNFEEAEHMLHDLIGKTHTVYSGVHLIHKHAGLEIGFVEKTDVTFRKLNTDAIRSYLARINPLDKAGAYSAQDDRGELIELTQGSFTNVVGLPMERLQEVLSKTAAYPTS